METQKEYDEKYNDFLEKSMALAEVYSYIPDNSIYHPKLIATADGQIIMPFETYETPGDLAKISQDPNDPSRKREWAIRMYAPDIVYLEDEKPPVFKVLSAFSKTEELPNIKAYMEEADAIVARLNINVKTITNMIKLVTPKAFAKIYGKRPKDVTTVRKTIKAFKKQGVDVRCIPHANLKARLFAEEGIHSDPARMLTHYINYHHKQGNTLEYDVLMLLLNYPELREQLRYTE